jgi:hypothetical protein
MNGASAGRGLRVAPGVWFALVALLYAGARTLHEPAWPTDFDQLWHAARALLAGTDPYQAVGPGKRFEWLWPLYYPLPAVLLAAPLAWLPVAAARVAFSTAAGGVLGWAMGARAAFLWPLALSASYLIAVSRTQWSPLLLAAAWVPALACLTLAKPNVGLAALAAHARPRALAVAVASAAAILVLSFAVRPDWLAAWRSAIADAPHIAAPVQRPFGILLLLAAIRWRRADARLLLVMACVPHTPSLYDLLPLFFVCRSLRETLVLALLTHAAFWGNVLTGSGTTFDAYADGLGRLIVLVVYLPALAAVLARPNQGDDALPAATAATWGAFLPRTNTDVTLTGILAVAAFFLVWLPLVTYR